jgi:mRNA-degrading endonuclease toxin of MazEF toxin-antitoxin module
VAFSCVVEKTGKAKQVVRRGFIYWIRDRQGKRRPALVISPDERNRLASDILVIPCSTQLRFGPWHVALARGEGGIDRTSVLRCEDVQPLPRELFDVTPLGGMLAKEKLGEIRRALVLAAGFAESLS